MIPRTDDVSLRHALLAIAVMAVWGTNFVVIHIGLQHLPPLMFAALRFTAALVPAVLFIRRPAVPWRNLAAYGLFIGVGQFGILFIAMNGQITPALASLVVQTQVFFTVALAAYQNGERVRPFQYVALTITVVGLLLIMAHTDASTTPLGLALVLWQRFAGRSATWSSAAHPMPTCWAMSFGRASSPFRRSLPLRSCWKAGRLFARALRTPTLQRWPPSCGRVSATRCSAMPCGAGCWGAIRLRDRAHVVAGAGIRVRRFGHLARRAAAGMEARSDGAGVARPAHQFLVAETAHRPSAPAAVARGIAGPLVTSQWLLPGA